MAERRMFSKKITDSARFIKMPAETQSLYFHLGLRADDDGVVEAFSVMRLVGATEDSLKLLSAKGFVRILNDDLVSHIIDWNEHNRIRADRKVDSLYKKLLLEVVPELELLEPKQRTDRKPKEPRDNNGTSQGQHSIGKDRVVEDSIGKDSKDEYIEATKVATYLANRILNYNSSAKINHDSWVKDIDRAIRIDKRTPKQLTELIDFIYEKETFWIPNIMSGKKLRDKYDTIYMKMKPQANKNSAYDDFVNEDSEEIIDVEPF